MAGGEEADGEAFVVEGLLKFEGFEAGGGDVVAGAEDVRIGFGGDDAIVTREVIGVTVGDEGPAMFAMGVEPEVGLGEVETVLGFELDGLWHQLDESTRGRGERWKNGGGGRSGAVREGGFDR